MILNTAVNLKAEWKEQSCHEKEELKESQDRKDMQIDSFNESNLRNLIKW